MRNVHNCKIRDQAEGEGSEGWERALTSSMPGHKGSGRVNRGPIPGRD
jgi:hypothetical protein